MIDERRNDASALLRLMQLVSPALPVGAYAYSQGMEFAVHTKWLQDEAAVGEWIQGLSQQLLARVDVPVLARLYRAWHTHDESALLYWSAYLRACRESRELQEEDRQLGGALARLLRDLDMTEAEAWIDHRNTAFAVLFSLAAVRWRIPLQVAAQGYLWAWAENQVAAAIKLVPLGQTAGQRILSRLSGSLPAAAARGLAMSDEQIGFVAQRWAMGSALHEHQYSRLFRS
ncbi:MAG: urease accessory UreF family protein [Gammaproteobacteria bacterium]|jgi:urease accessory protein